MSWEFGSPKKTSDESTAAVALAMASSSRHPRWTVSSGLALRLGRDLSVVLLFRFSDAGTISSVRADARGRTVKGRAVPTPWEGIWWQEERRDGMLIPISGEVSWLLPERRLPYWRGKITDLRYEYAT